MNKFTMLEKKTIKNILLEVEASNYNYEKYLQDIINEVLNDNNSDIKYIIARENNYDYLCLYKYNVNDYILWLYDNDAEDVEISDLINNYEIILEYVQKNYIDYYIEENITNFINIKKFRNMLYNNKLLLQEVANDIFTNIRNYSNNDYLIHEYNLNKKLYQALKRIQTEV